MIKKIIFLIFIFYFLVLFQNSFLNHFKVFGFSPGLILILIILINILEKPESKTGLIAGFLAGFYLDIFSISADFFFGFYTLIGLILSMLVKLILQKYVRLPNPQRI